MKKSKATKRTLLLSVLAMLLCMVMLVGTTFAWFTDSASTAVNTIQAGTLDVDLVDVNGNSLVGQPLSFKKAEGHENDEILWEPGATYALPAIKIVNKGNLWLKYKVEIAEGITKNASNEESNVSLLDAIDFYVIEGEVTTTPDLSGAKTLADYFAALNEAGEENIKTLAPKGEDGNETSALTIVGHMKELAGNEYQGLTLDGVAITVLATQYTKEYDSFGNDYDAQAGYPVSAEVSDKASLTEALNNPGVPVSITLTETIGSSRDLTVTGDVTLNLGQNRLNQSNMAIVGADLTVNNGGSLVINATSPEDWAYNAGKLMADGSGSSLTVNGGAYGDSGANNADVTARNGSVVYLNSGSFSTSGAYGHAVTAESGATVYISGGSFSTSGYQSSTIYANGGTIVITGLDSISANGFNYDVDNGGTITLSKTVSSSQPTRIGTGCTVTDDGDNWVITKA